jgi:GMP synthase (glutamine-hydrolysing)
MKIGILQTGYVPDDLSPRYVEYPQMFMRFLDGQGFDWETWAVLENRFPDSIHDCDGWLITGSRHGAYEDHVWIPPLEQFVRDAYAAGVPMAGICFGHQVMAQALGGKVVQFGGLWGVGKHVYDTPNGQIALMAMHQDQVVEIPDGARTIASSEFCKYAGLAYGNCAISYQPHPEFSMEYTRDLIETRAGSSIPADQAKLALEHIEGDLDADRIAEEIAAFFKSARSSQAAE